MQEPARRIHILAGSRTPRDDSILVAATVHPVIFGAPRPKTGRPCEAGFLAPGLSLSSAFPTLSRISGNSDACSPVTVAGAATALHRVPYTLHVACSCAIGGAKATARPSCKCGNTTRRTREFGRYRPLRLCARILANFQKSGDRHAAADQ